MKRLKNVRSPLTVWSEFEWEESAPQTDVSPLALFFFFTLPSGAPVRVHAAAYENAIRGSRSIEVSSVPGYRGGRGGPVPSVDVRGSFEAFGNIMVHSYILAGSNNPPR